MEVAYEEIFTLLFTSSLVNHTSHSGRLSVNQ